MVLMANLELPDRAIREQVASALHVIVQLARHSDGVRRVTHVTEVSGMEGLVITLQDIFRFEQSGIDEDGRIKGMIVPTGIRPTFAEKFELSGVHLPPNIFMSQSRL